MLRKEYVRGRNEYVLSTRLRETTITPDRIQAPEPPTPCLRGIRIQNSQVAVRVTKPVIHAVYPEKSYTRQSAFRIFRLLHRRPQRPQGAGATRNGQPLGRYTNRSSDARSVGQNYPGRDAICERL